MPSLTWLPASSPTLSNQMNIYNGDLYLDPTHDYTQAKISILQPKTSGSDFKSYTWPVTRANLPKVPPS